MPSLSESISPASDDEVFPDSRGLFSAFCFLLSAFWLPRAGAPSKSPLLSTNRPKLQAIDTSEMTRTPARTIRRFEGARSGKVGISIAANYDVVDWSRDTRMLTRIVQVNHYYDRDCHALRECGFPQSLDAC